MPAKMVFAPVKAMATLPELMNGKRRDRILSAEQRANQKTRLGHSLSRRCATESRE